VAEVAGQIQELEGERKELRTQREQALGELGAAQATAKQRAKIKAQSSEAERGLEDATVELAGALSAVRDSALEVTELTVCSQVLGLRGVRANVLGRALVGIEAAANAWLSKLAGGNLHLNLLSSVERKSGGSQDVIGLEVQGAGGGNGYRGASAGERRRIDVALLLALGEVAAGASGRSPGTLFADECFDALDSEGVSAAVTALSELAATRAVVVITHNEELAEALPAVQRIRLGA
jgi:DNA repair exonuclease SbcCD ATPase subunit